MSDPATIRILQQVGAFYHVSPAEIVGPRQHQHICRARHVAAWFITTLLKFSQPVVAQRLNRKDHSTISHSLDRTRAKMNSDDSFCLELATIRRMIDGPSQTTGSA